MINNKDNISVLRINRLKGRMLYAPAPKAKKREIWLVMPYGQLRAMFGIAAT